MTAIELTPATLSHLARLAGLADVDAFDPGDYSEHCDLSEMFALWLGIAVDDLETERDRELRPLHEARLLLDKVAVHLGVMPGMEEDPSGEQLLEAARMASSDRARLEVLELLAKAVERFTTRGGQPRVRVDLFSGGEQLPTVWLDTAPRIGEVLDLGIDGVPRCCVVGPLVRRGTVHFEVHVVPRPAAADGGEF